MPKNDPSYRSMQVWPETLYILKEIALKRRTSLIKLMKRLAEEEKAREDKRQTVKK